MMRFMTYAVLSASLSAVPSFANEDLEFVPTTYRCEDAENGSMHKHTVDVTKNNGKYSVTFANKMPGDLGDYLRPLGVDPRIISNYKNWNIRIEIPEDDCQAKTFASKYPEHLKCKTDNVMLAINALYKIGSEEKVDRYKFPNAKFDLVIKAVRYKRGIVRDGLSFDMSSKIVGTDGQVYTVVANNTYPIHLENDEACSSVYSECRLKALDNVVDISLQDVLKRRK